MTPGRKKIVRRVVKTTLGFAVVAFAVHLLLPNLSSIRDSGRLLVSATWIELAAIFGCQMISLLAYGELVRTVLHCAEQQAPRHLVQRAMVAGSSVNRTVPWGSGASLAVITGALRRGGFDSARSMASVIASGMLSSFVLALFLPAAALMSVALGQGGGVVFGVIGVAAVVVATAVTARLVSRKPDKLGRFIERIATPAARGPLRRVVQPKAIGAAIVRALSGIDRLARDRGALARASFWAFLNWLMDFGVLVAVAMSIGHGISISALALAFVVGQLVAALPITPGGLGVVEAAVTAALIAQGAPPAAATVTVLAWRLVSHWLPIVIGYIVLPTLGFGQRRVPAVDVPAPVAVA